MRLFWGDFLIGAGDGATKSSWRSTPVKNRAGYVTGLTGQCEVEDAFLLVDPAANTPALRQADIKAQMAAVEAARRVRYQDLVFMNDDGTPSANAVLDANTLSGVSWDDLRWGTDPGGQFVSQRTFSASFSWEVTTVDPAKYGTLLVDFQETLTISGGVPRSVVLEYVNDVAPESQITVPQTKYRATQTGFAVGYLFLPDPAPPLWTGSPPLVDKTVTEVSGERTGNSLRNRRRQWTYQYESPTPLVGSATQWTGAF